MRLVFPFVIASLMFGMSAQLAALTLEYRTPFSGGDARPMQNMVAAFNQAHPDINVKVRQITWEHYYPELKRFLKSRNAPDIAVAHASKLTELNESGALESININAKQVGVDWSSFQESVLEQVRFDGNYLAIPLDSHALVMYFNRRILGELKLLNKQGFPRMEGGKQGFLDFLKAIRKRSHGSVLPFGSPNNNVYPFWIWYALYSQIEGGGAYISNGRAAFNNEAGREALDVLVEMRDQALWLPDVNDQKGYNLFKYERAAIIFSGVWATWNFEQNEQLQFGVTILPTLFDHAATWGDSHTLIFPRMGAGHRKNAALRFAEWLAEHGEFWAVAGHVPSKREVLQKSNFMQLPHRMDYVGAVEQVRAYPRHPKLWQCNERMVEVFVDLMNGNYSVENALAKAEHDINDILVGSSRPGQ